MIHRLLDRLAERYSEREHKLEAMRAREEYFDRAGKVFDDDAELFEGRMASFLEWYVLERPSSTLGGALPVVAVPVPLTPLPIGVQIIAAPWREDVALRIAHTLESMGVCAAPKPAI
jgi:hypothetical protein